MMGQTISLFRFLLLGVLNLRLFALVSILVIVAGLLSSFITELRALNQTLDSEGYICSEYTHRWQPQPITL